MSKISILKQFYAKTVTIIKAYGTDEFDFTRNLLGVDFSVGQFGYTALEFGDDKIYISVDGLSSVIPPRGNLNELVVEDGVRNCFKIEILDIVPPLS